MSILIVTIILYFYLYGLEAEPERLVVKNACLLVRYLTMDILYCRVLLYALPNNGLFTKNLYPRERVYRPVA
jgi:hypothetical protein